MTVQLETIASNRVEAGNCRADPNLRISVAVTVRFSFLSILHRESESFNLDSEAVVTYPGRSVLNNVELTSLIFSFLKNEACLASARMANTQRMWTLSAPWRSEFAGWARVNHAFFDASTAVLWERMTSLEPFFLMLPSVGEDEWNSRPEALLSFASRVPARTWDRFIEYSSKTKYLTFDSSKSSPRISLLWVTYLVVKKYSDRPFLPALNILFLNSLDDLSLFVAFSVAERLSSIVIDLPEDGASVAAQIEAISTLNTISVGSTTLSHYCLVQPFSPDAVASITRMKNLTNLHLTFDHKMGPSVLSCINQLPLLEELSLRQETGEMIPLPFPEETELQLYLCKRTELPYLRRLSVSANGLYQFMVATELFPSSLVTLSLHVDLDLRTPYAHVLLVPLVMTIYATRNPSLTDVDVSCPTKVPNGLDFSGMAHLRHDAQLNATSPLMAALSGLRDLRTLRIERVPFLLPETFNNILKACSKLPELRLLSLFPRHMQLDGADRLIWPRLQSLEPFSRGCPRLTDFGMYVSFQGAIPAPPTDYISTNTLCRLDLKSTETVEGPEFSLDVKLAMGRYIDRLFPRVERLAGYGALKPVERAMWNDVERIVWHFQDLRAQSIQDLGSG